MVESDGVYDSSSSNPSTTQPTVGGYKSAIIPSPTTTLDILPAISYARTLE